MNTAQHALRAIETSIVESNITPDLASQATHLVFGSGNPSADVMFVGEAPGKKEDEIGLPFVGAAGALLDELLHSINLDRDGVYITNIVKYRPPRNRDPSLSEKRAFWPFLVQQVEAVQPRILVTLGRHSMEQFLPGAKISQIHGVPQSILLPTTPQNGIHDQQERVLVPLYHPAAALYNPGLRQILFEDMKQLNHSIFRNIT